MRFGPFALVPAPEWNDITHEVQWGEDEEPLLTFGRPEGDGAFQISAMHYVGSKKPPPSTDEMLELLTRWSSGHGVQIADATRLAGSSTIVAANHRSADRFVRFWLVFDHGAFLFATYTSTTGNPREIADCDAMVQTLRLAAVGKADRPRS